MEIIDKFLDAMKLNSDDDDEYEFDNEEYFDEPDDYEEKPKHSFRHSKKEKASDNNYLSIEEDKSEKIAKTTPKVTPIRQTRKQVGSMEVCVIKPTSVEDAREITETLLNGRTVVLNMEGVNLDIAQRIVDFTSGSCFAISGNLQKISNFIFIITPPNVEISGDFQDLLSTFDGTSIQTDL